MRVLPRLYRLAASVTGRSAAKSPPASIYKRIGWSAATLVAAGAAVHQAEQSSHCDPVVVIRQFASFLHPGYSHPTDAVQQLCVDANLTAPHAAEKIQHAFRVLDRAHKEKITKRELAILLKNIGVTDGAVVDKFFGFFDQDQDGTIDIHDFVGFTSLLVHGTPNEKVKLCFNLADLDNDGHLTRDDLRTTLRNLLRMNSKLTNVDVTDSPMFAGMHPESVIQFMANCTTIEVFAGADPKNQNNLSFEDFSRWVSKGGPTASRLLEIFDSFGNFSPV